MWLILLIMGQKWIDFLFTGQTVRVHSSKGRMGRAEVVSSGLISQSDYIFMILFIYLGRGVPPILRLLPAGFCVICLLWVNAPIQSTLLQWQSQTEHTHPRTLARTYNPPHLSRRVCSPQLARPLPAARTHIVSHRRPPPILSPPTAPQGLSGFLWDFLALSLPPAPCLNLSYLSMNRCISLSACPSIDQSISARPRLSLYLRLDPPKGEREQGGSGPGARPFSIWISLQTVQHVTEE